MEDYEVKVEVLCLPGNRKVRRGGKVTAEQCGGSFRRFLDNGSIVKMKAQKTEETEESAESKEPAKADPKFYRKGK